MIDELYSARILALAANCRAPVGLHAPEGSAERVAKLCGSKWSSMWCWMARRIADFAQEVKACALGQAAAAVLGESVIGASVGKSRWPATGSVLC